MKRLGLISSPMKIIQTATCGLFAMLLISPVTAEQVDKPKAEIERIKSIIHQEYQSESYEYIETPLKDTIPSIEKKSKLIDPKGKGIKITLKSPIPYLIHARIDANSIKSKLDTLTFLSNTHYEVTAKGVEIYPFHTDENLKNLSFSSRRSQIYRLVFAARPDRESFQIRREATAKWRQRTNFILKTGEKSADGQFRVDSYVEKSATRQGISIDASILKITYLPDGSKRDLVRRIPTDIPTYFAEFFTGGTNSETVLVKEGESLSLDPDEAILYQVIKVTEEYAIIRFGKESDGKWKFAKIKK